MRSIVFSLSLVLAACATAPTPEQTAAARTKPQLDLREVVGPRDVMYPRGPIDVQYELSVANPAGDPITIRRVELVSVGSGPYQLRPDYYTFNKVIAPNGTEAVKFWARGYLYVISTEMRANEPMLLRATVTFDSPRGSFRQVLMKNLSQYSQ